jgi:hypothetical protein
MPDENQSGTEIRAEFNAQPDETATGQVSGKELAGRVLKKAIEGIRERQRTGVWPKVY